MTMTMMHSELVLGAGLPREAPDMFIRTASFLSLTLVLALSTGCGETSTAPRSDLQFFPLAVGNTWEYAPDDPTFGESFEWIVTDRRGDTVELLRPRGGSHPGAVTLMDHVSRVDLLLDGERSAPFYRFTPGASWVHRDPWECDDDATVLAVEEPNTVVTPAGAFAHCLRVERRTPASCTDAGTMEEWWAPGVGLVQWEELNFYAGGPVTFRLVGYTVE